MLQKGFWFSRSWLPLTSKGTKALSTCPWIQSLVEGKTPAFLDSCAVSPFKARSTFLSENREQGFNGTVEHLPLCTGKYRWVSASVMSSSVLEGMLLWVMGLSWSFSTQNFPSLWCYLLELTVVTFRKMSVLNQQTFLREHPPEHWLIWFEFPLSDISPQEMISSTIPYENSSGNELLIVLILGALILSSSSDLCISASQTVLLGWPVLEYMESLLKYRLHFRSEIRIRMGQEGPRYLCM